MSGQCVEGRLAILEAEEEAAAFLKRDCLSFCAWANAGRLRYRRQPPRRGIMLDAPEAMR